MLRIAIITAALLTLSAPALAQDADPGNRQWIADTAAWAADLSASEAPSADEIAACAEAIDDLPVSEATKDALRRLLPQPTSAGGDATADRGHQ